MPEDAPRRRGLVPGAGLADDPKQIRHIIAFAKEHHFAKSHAAMVTTKTVHELRVIKDVSVAFVPTSLYAYVLGKTGLELEKLVINIARDM